MSSSHKRRNPTTNPHPKRTTSISPSTNKERHFVFIKHEAKDLEAAISHSRRLTHARRILKKNKSSFLRLQFPASYCSENFQNDSYLVEDNRQSEDDKWDRNISTSRTPLRKCFQSVGIIPYRRSPGLLTILQKGNSDPFCSSAVDVDAQNSGLISFGRDVILPHMFPSEPRSTDPFFILDRTRQATLNSLHDECTGWVWLSTIASAYALVSSKYSQFLLGRSALYLQRSYVNLQKRLHNLSFWHDPKIYFTILAIISAELAAYNIAAAGVHSKALYQLFERDGGVERIDPWLLETALAIENIRFVFTGTRSFFTFPNWNITHLRHGIKEVSLPQRPDLPSGFKDSLNDEALILILNDLQDVFETDYRLTLQGGVVADKIFRSMNIRQRICNGRLFNYYLDSSDNTLISRLGSAGTPITAINRAVSLGALFWSWMRSHNSKYDYGCPLLYKLRDALAQCVSQVACYTCSPRLRLWVFYVGAMMEQTYAGGGAADHQDMNLLFTNQARLMSLASWLEVRRELLNFLYSDTMKPHGSEWFWRAQTLLN